MAGYSDFSFTAIWAWIGDHVDARLRASGNVPGGVVVELPEIERAVLANHIAPHLNELEELRLQTFETIDRRARLLVPLAGGAAFVALVASGHDALPVIVFTLAAVLAAWFLSMSNRASKYQNEVKQRFSTIITGHLSGFDHVVEPKTDLQKLRDWHLFPKLQSSLTQTSDLITGERDGHHLSLAEMTIQHAPRKDKRQDHRFTVTAVEVLTEATRGSILTLTPLSAPYRVLEEQAKASDLPQITTDDARLHEAYSLRASDPDAGYGLSPALREAILDLDTVTPAGRPFLAFLPDRIVVLFPTAFVDLAFHAPPYWVPIDADALLAQFASDLAVKNRLINATLNLATVLDTK